MKDFAGSSITYYGLAREKLMNKYPRLISVLMILALICMTGLAIFLISDLVSFASNPDHKGVLATLDLKGPENGIVSMTDGKEKSRNIGANSSPSLENLSGQTKGPNFAKLSQMNASQSSSQAAKGGVAASKSSSSNSRKSVDETSGSSPAIKHHSSSSSSSAKSAKKSNDKNNLTQEGNSSKNNISTNALAINETAKSLIGNSSNLSNDGQRSVLSDQESANSQISNASARVPSVMIQFKTDVSSIAKSEQSLNTESATVSDAIAPSESGSPESGPAADNSNIAQSSKDSKKNPSSKAIGKQRTSSQKSKVTISSQAQKAQQTRDKQKANRNQMVENMKKKAAKSRAKAASK